MLKSPGSTPCKFRTAYDIHIAPITISDARIAPIDVPAVLRLPSNAAASLRVTIESTSSSKPLQSDEPLAAQFEHAGAGRLPDVFVARPCLRNPTEDALLYVAVLQA